jgi:hypothetical protein
MVYVDALDFRVKLWCCYFGIGHFFSKIGQNLDHISGHTG